MFDKLTKRAVSLLAAAVMTMSNITSVYAEDITTAPTEATTSATEAATEVETTAEPASEELASEELASEELASEELSSEEPTDTTQEEAELTYQIIELYPDEEAEEKVVTLDGLMPEGAEATAVDVSEEHDGVAAYDITITAGEEEYQPGEEHPLLVEITDPVIADAEHIELWHILDDGTREQIYDFTLEDGTVSFYATGFSVYEIVVDENVKPFVPILDSVTSIDDLTGDRASEGFYLYYGNGKLFSSSLNSNSALIEKDSVLDAAVWYFEQDGNNFKIYTYIDKVKKYIHNKSGNLLELSSTTGDSINITDAIAGVSFYFKQSDADKWLQHSNGGEGIRYFTDNNNATNAKIKLYFADKAKISDDPYKLNGKTYGLMRYVSGATGHALMAADTNETTTSKNAMELLAYVIRPDADRHETVYVAEDADISEWTFENVAEDRYYIYADFSGTRKYLKIPSDGYPSFVTVENGATLTETALKELEIQVVPGSGNNAGKIKLVSNGKSIKLGTVGEGDDKRTVFQFVASTDGDYLNLVDLKELPENDKFATYKAREISVCDVRDGEEIIIYTRVWNESNKRYDFYAVADDGTLVPCYERGNSIMWLSGKRNTLIWKFTEYHYEYTNTPNYYYELYNPYSQKYIAPIRPNASLPNGQVLSDNKIGINLPGRKNGDFYTDILAWDDVSYSYSGLGVSDDDKQVVPTTRHLADTFYFARLVDLANDLTEVATVNNNDYGITMKMIDFDEINKEIEQKYVNDAADANNLMSSNIKSDGPATRSRFTWEYFGGIHNRNGDEYPTQGLLSTNLVDGYPLSNVATYENVKKYDNGETPSIPNPNYNKSIAPAFANADTVNHLFIQSILEQSGYFVFDSCQNYATLKNQDGNFFVSKELGTHDKRTSKSLKHGQFYPYDDIDMDTYAKNNEENKYKATGEELPEDDPRKYEKMHLIEDPDYYFGMELSASFTQTPNGKDNWGHDIIFEFTGDDDFWLYVDGELVIDLGGTHSALAGNVNFATGDVVVNNQSSNLRDVFRQNYITRNPGATQEQINSFLAQYFDWDSAKNEYEKIFKDYTKHNMKIFYMERGASASNLHMRFNLSYVKPGDVLLTKEISGTDDLDFEMVEYPFQIYYRFDENGTEHILGDETDDTQDAAVFITYENSTKTVQHLQTYTPPGAAGTTPYKSVFFINPTNKAVIHFPTNTYQYKIVECGMDKDIYDKATINNVQLLPSDADSTSSNDAQPSVRQNGDRYDYDSGWMTVETNGYATFDNHVDPNGLRKLRFTKELYDNDYVYGPNLSSDYKNAHKMTAEQDPTTFTFRLYLSNGTSDELPLAYMVNYRVLDPEYYYCTWDSINQEFARYVYNGEYVTAATLDAILESLTSKAEREEMLRDMTFECSMNGSISKIPAWYTVEVPNLPVGLTFMVEERDSTAERPLGYERVIYERDAGSYDLLESGVENKGRIEKEKSPMLRVINQRGYELQAVKDWSDKDFVAGHDDIFMALYVKNGSGGYDLASDYITSPVRRLSSPNTEIRFFMNQLRDKSLSDFAIFEVTSPDGAYTVDEKGFVTLGSGTTVERIEDGEMKLVIPSADRIIAADSTAAVFQNVEFLDTNNASDWSVQKQFDKQSNLYGDRVIKAGDVPTYLLGAEYLRTADDSKSYSNDLCTFTAGADADIYVAWDSHIGTKPSWLNEWTELPDTIQTATTLAVTMKLFKKAVTQGESVKLGSNIGGTAPTGSYHNYFVLAIPKYSEGRTIKPGSNWIADWSIQQAFDSSTFPYNDRDVRVDEDGFPEKYTGAEYVLTTASAGTPSIEVKTNAVVYVALDSGIARPAWLNGWVQTNDTIKTSNGRTMLIYKKECAENDSITLGDNTVSGSENPYFVLALPKYTYETTYSIGAETNAMVVLQGTANSGDITGLYCKGSDGQYHLAAASEHPIRQFQSNEIKYYLQSNAIAIEDYKIYKLNLSGYKYTVDQDGIVTVNDGDITQGKQLVTAHSSLDTDRKAKITGNYTWSSTNANGVFVALYQNINGTWNLVPGTEVKRLSSPVSKVSYTVIVPPELPEGTTEDDYLEAFKVCAVTMAGNGYLVDNNGYMTQISSSGSTEESFTESMIQKNGEINATPVVFTTREDMVSNTRTGGVEIDLYQMGTRNVPETHIDGDPGTALQGGVFELYHGDELIGTYVSDARGRITVMYNYIQNDEYTLVQKSAPKSYIGLKDPVVFRVQKSSTTADVTVNNSNEWKDYHIPSSQGDRLVAFIDVYNKPFILRAIKVDSKEVDDAGNPKPIEGVKFALYYGVTGLGGWTPGTVVKPVETYGNLMTDENGQIDNISQALEEGVYFLKEVSAKSGYQLLDRYIRINVTENDVDIRNSQDDPTAYESTDGTVTTITLNSGIKLIKTDDDHSKTCEIMIPNEKAISDYYFDIEKIIFADKNMHDSDAEQKFLFKVEHLNGNTVDDCFYVTLNCKDSVNAYPYTGNLEQFEGHTFNAADSSVTVSYGSNKSYTYPAAVLQGTQSVKVEKKGTYRVTELTEWSCTDYDFWKGSQLFISNDTSRTGTYSSDSAADPYVEFVVTDTDADKTQCPKVSFTNAETEFAYLSSQAYAENTIK